MVIYSENKTNTTKVALEEYSFIIYTFREISLHTSSTISEFMIVIYNINILDFSFF